MKRIVDRAGQVLVFVALALFVLLGFAALGIDVGYLYTIRNELQRSADSGALAGASAFLEGAWDNTNLLSPTMVQADSRARDYASRDLVASAALNPAAEVAVSFPTNDRIRVTTSRNAPLFFARILGRNSQVVTATAVAEAAVSNVGVTCLKPWAIPLPWNDSDGDRQFDPGEDVLYDIDAIPVGTRMILHLGDPLGQPGQSNDNAIQQEAGHFFNISLCDDSGASDYRDRIADVDCSDDCAISVGDNYDPLANPEYQVRTLPGMAAGPTWQGFQDLIRLDPNASWDPNSGVVNSSYGPGASPRIVHIPLYDPSDAVAGDPNMEMPNGMIPIRIATFAGFFVEAVVNDPGGQRTIVGYLMSDDSAGSSSTTGPSPGASLKVLRLVE